ncbi:hypothetical protein EYF80_018432 [Liparis tanakae]|uniref:Uncharacterized protein n=1 Tax=Liparis tanakae TaxID=230148 RepID=A0A4Z2I233_9TELE|nr:hypothetical protein EYF80_018432 [Liparis tanakae]
MAVWTQRLSLGFYRQAGYTWWDTADRAGPGWTGRLGGEVTSHKLVVLLVGLHGQSGLALETGGQVRYLQRGETRWQRLQGVEVAVRVQALGRPASSGGRHVNLIFRGKAHCHVVTLEVLSWSLRNGLEVEEHRPLRRLIGVNCRAAELLEKGLRPPAKDCSWLCESRSGRDTARVRPTEDSRPGLLAELHRARTSSCQRTDSFTAKRIYDSCIGYHGHGAGGPLTSSSVLWALEHTEMPRQQSRRRCFSTAQPDRDAASRRPQPMRRQKGPPPLKASKIRPAPTGFMLFQRHRRDRLVRWIKPLQSSGTGRESTCEGKYKIPEELRSPS